MKINISNIDKYSNKVIVFDNSSQSSGKLRLANWKELILRQIIPIYARRQDAQVAHELYLTLQKQDLSETEYRTVNSFLNKKN